MRFYFLILIAAFAPSLSVAQPVDFYASAGAKYVGKETLSTSYDVSPSILPTGISYENIIDISDAVGVEGTFGVKISNFYAGFVIDHYSPSATPSG